MRLYHVGIILISIPLSASEPSIPLTKKLDKNQEYVCVAWTGSSDYTQNQPSRCVKWEVRDKPWNRRVL